MTDNGKGWIERIGCRLSEAVADVVGHPYAQLGLLVLCGLWWSLQLAVEVLTAILSILAITLTQMVLNRQDQREAEDRRRDVAMHAKLDELIIALKGPRNEMAGIEALDEEAIAELKDEVKEAIDRSGEPSLDHGDRAAAKRAVDSAALRRRK